MVRHKTQDTRLKTDYRGRRDWYRKFKLMAKKLLIGWFMECLACKATFIRTTPENTSMVDTGDSILVKTRNGNRETRIETVRCPDCLSANVRLMEIGDGK